MIIGYNNHYNKTNQATAVCFIERRNDGGMKNVVIYNDIGMSLVHFDEGGVAHRLEQIAHNDLVVGSIPTAPTIKLTLNLIWLCL